MYCYGSIKLLNCFFVSYIISVIFRKNCQEKMRLNYLSQEYAFKCYSLLGQYL